MATNYNGIPNLYVDSISGSRGAHNVLVYAPADYLTKQYPCVMYFNGAGEDSGDVSVLAKYALLFEIATAGYQPKCIAICVEALAWDNQQDTIYTTLKKKYNWNKLILNGISEGGWEATCVLAGINMPGVTGPGAGNPMTADAVCAILMSSQADATVYPQAVAPIVKMGIPVLGSGDNPGDSHGIDTNNFILALQKANPNGNYTFINTPGTGHGGWNALSGPTYKLPNGQYIWDWALSFAGSATTAPPVTTTPPVTTPPVTTPPVVTPPVSTPKTIKSILVTYSDGTTLTLP